MHFLPSLQLHDHAVHLPLSRGAQELLTGVLLGEPVSATRLAEILPCDPALTLFLAACHASESGTRGLGITAIASRLNPATLSKILNRSFPSNSRNADLYFEMACSGYARVAGEFRDAPAEDEAMDELLLESILMDAPLWCEAGLNFDQVSSGSRTANPPVDMAPLKQWLAERMEERASATGDCSDTVPAIERMAAEKVRRYWDGSHSIDNWLPKLAMQMRELNDLKVDFDGKLHESKLKAMKELAYGASHEINNPLANISSRAQSLLREEKDPDRRETLAAINRQAFRAYEMIADMMLFAHPPEMKPESVNVRDAIQEVVEGISDDVTAGGNRVSISNVDSQLAVAADPVQLAVAVKALLRNSIESVGSGGNIRVDACHHPDLEAVHIAVHDDGPGIDVDIREHMFEPFFSGREAGRGLGFGLSKAWRIMAEHGGKIQVDSNPNQPGVCFTLCFPQ